MAAQVVAASGTAAAAATRALGGGSGADGLRPSPRLQLGTCASRERWGGGAVAARARRNSQVVSVISRAPRADPEVLPVSPDDDAAVKVARHLLFLVLVVQLRHARAYLVGFGMGM